MTKSVRNETEFRGKMQIQNIQGQKMQGAPLADDGPPMENTPPKAGEAFGDLFARWNFSAEAKLRESGPEDSTNDPSMQGNPTEPAVSAVASTSQSSAPESARTGLDMPAGNKNKISAHPNKPIETVNAPDPPIQSRSVDNAETRQDGIPPEISGTASGLDTADLHMDKAELALAERVGKIAAQTERTTSLSEPNGGTRSIPAENPVSGQEIKQPAMTNPGRPPYMKSPVSEVGTAPADLRANDPVLGPSKTATIRNEHSVSSVMSETIETIGNSQLGLGGARIGSDTTARNTNEQIPRGGNKQTETASHELRVATNAKQFSNAIATPDIADPSVETVSGRALNPNLAPSMASVGPLTAQSPNAGDKSAAGSTSISPKKAPDQPQAQDNQQVLANLRTRVFTPQGEGPVTGNLPHATIPNRAQDRLPHPISANTEPPAPGELRLNAAHGKMMGTPEPTDASEIAAANNNQTIPGNWQPSARSTFPHPAPPVDGQISKAPVPRAPQTPDGPVLAMADPVPGMDADRAVTEFNTDSDKLSPFPMLESPPSAALPLTTTATRYETARLVAAQLVDGLPNLPGKPVEIALNPEELGRVRMTLSTSETSVSVSIMAERPETLDLMRRHADQLSAELRRMGYENVGFEFNGGSAGGFEHNNNDGSSGDLAEPDVIETETASPTRPAQTAAPGGLDLRL